MEIQQDGYIHIKLIIEKKFLLKESLNVACDPTII